MAKKAEFSIETVKKYALWVAVPLALVIASVGTVLAVGKVSAVFTSKSNTLEGKKAAVEKISSNRAHPNQNTITEIENLKTQLTVNVSRAWGTMEYEQRQRNQWPAKLGPGFAEEVSKKIFGSELSQDALEVYMNFIREYIPEMEVYVDRRRFQVRNREGGWDEYDEFRMPNVSVPNDPLAGMGSNYGGGSGSGPGGGSNRSEGGISSLPRSEDGQELIQWTGTVVWTTPETRRITELWGSIPKSKEVWYAQEDLWVYNALLSVVRNSNIGASGPHNAKVKRIDALLIGQEASAILQERSQARLGGSSASAGSGSGTSPSPGSDIAGGGPGSSSGPTTIRTEADVDKVKRQNRYVDDKGTPLAADAKSPYEEFNRMPICMRLLVDQKEIPKILVNCANCDMPIDILWVRINPSGAKPFELTAHDPTASAAESSSGSGSPSGSSYGGGSPGGSSYGGGSPGGGSGYGSGGPSGASSPSGSDIQVKLDGVGGLFGTDAIEIEIIGCINIFNPHEHGGLESEETREGAETQP